MGFYLVCFLGHASCSEGWEQPAMCKLQGCVGMLWNVGFIIINMFFIKVQYLEMIESAVYIGRFFVCLFYYFDSFGSI